MYRPIIFPGLRNQIRGSPFQTSWPSSSSSSPSSSSPSTPPRDNRPPLPLYTPELPPEYSPPDTPTTTPATPTPSPRRPSTQRPSRIPRLPGSTRSASSSIPSASSPVSPNPSSLPVQTQIPETPSQTTGTSFATTIQRPGTPAVRIPPRPENQYQASYIITDRLRDYNTSLNSPTPVRVGTTLQGVQPSLCDELLDSIIQIFTKSNEGEPPLSIVEVNNYLDGLKNSLTIFPENNNNFNENANHNNQQGNMTANLGENNNNGGEGASTPRPSIPANAVQYDGNSGEGASSSAPASTTDATAAGSEGAQTPPTLGKRIEGVRKEAIGRVILDTLAAQKRQADEQGRKFQQMEGSLDDTREAMRRMQSDLANIKLLVDRNVNTRSPNAATGRAESNRTIYGWVKWIFCVLCVPHFEDSHGLRAQNQNQNRSGSCRSRTQREQPRPQQPLGNTQNENQETAASTAPAAEQSNETSPLLGGGQN